MGLTKKRDSSSKIESNQKSNSCYPKKPIKYYIDLAIYKIKIKVPQTKKLMILKQT